MVSVFLLCEWQSASSLNQTCGICITFQIIDVSMRHRMDRLTHAVEHWISQINKMGVGYDSFQRVKDSIIYDLPDIRRYHPVIPRYLVRRVKRELSGMYPTAQGAQPPPERPRALLGLPGADLRKLRFGIPGQAFDPLSKFSQRPRSSAYCPDPRDVPRLQGNVRNALLAGPLRRLVR
jgi:hypothetical protein